MGFSVVILSSCQGMQYDLIIFAAGHGPMNERPIGPDSLLDTHRDLYVISTRERFNLIIIASMKDLQASCRNWESIINDFGGIQI